MNRSLVQFLITLIIALAALVGYVVWFFVLSSARDEAKAAALEVARIEKENAAIANAQDTIAALASDEAMLRSRFVTKSGVVPFLEELERSGDSLGSAVEVVSVTEPTEAGGRLTLAISIEGSFASVMRTVGSLEHGPRDMRLLSLTFDTPPSDEEAPWVAAATFSVGTIEETP